MKVRPSCRLNWMMPWPIRIGVQSNTCASCWDSFTSSSCEGRVSATLHMQFHLVPLPPPPSPLPFGAVGVVWGLGFGLWRGGWLCGGALCRWGWNCVSHANSASR
eukprot:6362681-Karenia_brevis.AAC.1